MYSCASLQINGQQIKPVHYDSTTELSFTAPTPAKTTCGAATITVTNPDTQQATRNDLASYYSPTPSYTVPKTVSTISSTELLLSDVDNDGNLDMVVGGGKVSANLLLVGMVEYGDGTGAFPKSSNINKGMTTTGAASTGGFAVADLNQDGLLDVIFAMTDTGNGANYLVNTIQRAGGFFTSLSSNAQMVPSALSAIAVGDVNGDKQSDVIAYSGSSAIGVLLGNGTNSFDVAGLANRSISLANNASGVALRLGDLNMDGNLDVLAGLGYSAAPLDGVQTGFGRGDGTFQSLIKSGACSNPKSNDSLVAADFNGDHKLDVASSTRVCLGDGAGGFTDTMQSIGAAPNALAAGDLNGDGILDLVAVDGAMLNILIGRGDGTFKNASSSPVSANSTVRVGDLNHDGMLDLVVGVPGTLQVLLWQCGP